MVFNTLLTINTRHYHLQEYVPTAQLLENHAYKNMATAVFTFFQYDLYCGSLSRIFWALILYVRSRRSSLSIRQCLLLFCKTLGVRVIGSPSAVVVFLSYSRDLEASLSIYNQEGKYT